MAGTATVRFSTGWRSISLPGRIYLLCQYQRRYVCDGGTFINVEWGISLGYGPAGALFLEDRDVNRDVSLSKKEVFKSYGGTATEKDQDSVEKEGSRKAVADLPGTKKALK